MPLLVEICIVVATLSTVAIAVAAVRAMFSVQRVTERMSRLADELHEWIQQAQALTRETHQTVISIRGLVAPLHQVVDRLTPLGARTADLSAALLGEVVPSLRTAVAVARGVRALTNNVLQGLSHRFTNGRSTTQGESTNA